ARQPWQRPTQTRPTHAPRYTPPPQGKIPLPPATAGDRAHLTVGNTGPPVPPYEGPALFEPFRRLRDAERLAESAPASSPGRGAGLGLSIVRSVARTHGGEVQATPRQDGGLIVQVRLPAAPQRP